MDYKETSTIGENMSDRTMNKILKILEKNGDKDKLSSQSQRELIELLDKLDSSISCGYLMSLDLIFRISWDSPIYKLLKEKMYDYKKRIITNNIKIAEAVGKHSLADRERDYLRYIGDIHGDDDD